MCSWTGAAWRLGLIGALLLALSRLSCAVYITVASAEGQPDGSVGLFTTPGGRTVFPPGEYRILYLRGCLKLSTGGWCIGDGNKVGWYLTRPNRDKIFPAPDLDSCGALIEDKKFVYGDVKPCPELGSTSPERCVIKAVDGAEACCEFCKDLQECGAFTYMTSDKTCVLKRASGYYEANAALHTSARVTKYPGNWPFANKPTNSVNYTIFSNCESAAKGQLYEPIHLEHTGGRLGVFLDGGRPDGFYESGRLNPAVYANNKPGKPNPTWVLQYEIGDFTGHPIRHLSGKCLQPENGGVPTPGERAVLSAAGCTHRYSGNAAYGGTDLIKHVKSGLCLSVTDNIPVDGTPVTFERCKYSDPQMMRQTLSKAVVQLSSEKCWQVSGGVVSPKDGSGVVIAPGCSTQFILNTGLSFLSSTGASLYTVVTDAKNQNDATAACALEGGALVSFTSRAEYTEVANTVLYLWRDNFPSFSKTICTAVPMTSSLVYTGIWYDHETNLWKTPDGAVQNDLQWAPGEPSTPVASKTCAALYTGSMDNMAIWTTRKLSLAAISCDCQMPFVCKTPVKPFAIQHRLGACAGPASGKAQRGARLQLSVAACSEHRFLRQPNGIIKHIPSRLCLHPLGNRQVPAGNTPVVFTGNCTNQPAIRWHVPPSGGLMHSQSGMCFHYEAWPEGTAPPENSTIVLSYQCDPDDRFTLTAEPVDGCRDCKFNSSLEGTRVVVREQKYFITPCSMDVAAAGMLEKCSVVHFSGKRVQSVCGEDWCYWRFDQSWSDKAQPYYIRSHRCGRPGTSIEYPTPTEVGWECRRKVVHGIRHRSGRYLMPFLNEAKPRQRAVLSKSQTSHKFVYLPTRAIQHAQSGLCLHPENNDPTPGAGLALVFDQGCGNNNFTWTHLPDTSAFRLDSDTTSCWWPSKSGITWSVLLKPECSTADAVFSFDPCMKAREHINSATGKCER